LSAVKESKEARMKSAPKRAIFCHTCSLAAEITGPRTRREAPFDATAVQNGGNSAPEVPDVALQKSIRERI
jgi:hypothetical protein